MAFDPALYDGSDPFYAPGLSYNSRGYGTWAAGRRYVKAGWLPRSVTLPGRKGDGDDLARAARARELTREMLAWWNEQGEQKLDPATWAYLFARYRSDEFSPIHNVKANTRDAYLYQTAKLEPAIGHMRITDFSYETAMTMKLAMERKGRSADYIKRLFDQIVRVARYGRALRLEGCRDAMDVLAGVKRPSSAPRSVSMTRAQIEAMVDCCDAKGLFALGTGFLLCFELILRAVDVRGQWLETDEDSGIIRDGKRWQDGLTWDMIGPDWTLRKVISKTAKSMPEAYEWDLTKLPVLQARLRLLKKVNGGVGPVILSERDNLPYTVYGWSQGFRRIKRALKLPEEFTAMDLRASGVTEAKALVKRDAFALRDAAGHKHIETTSRYARQRSEGANKVIELRKSR